MEYTDEINDELLSQVDDREAWEYFFGVYIDATFATLDRAFSLILSMGGDIYKIYGEPRENVISRINPEHTELITSVGVAEDHEVDLVKVDEHIMVRKTADLREVATELSAYAVLGENRHTPKIYGFDVRLDLTRDNVEDSGNGVIYMEPCQFSVGSKMWEKDVDTLNISLLIEDLIEGLKYIHSKDILHGDIKPANILICNGRAKLADFGLSETRMPRHVPANKYTDLYKPPELYAVWIKYGDAILFDEVRFPLEPSQDVYALGCTLYYIIAGDNVFSQPKSAGIDDFWNIPLYQANKLSRCMSEIDWVSEAYASVEFKDVEFTDPLHTAGEYEAMLRKMLASDPAERIY